MTDNPDSETSKGSINRRSILKTAAAVTGASALGMKAGATKGDYEVIEVSPGEVWSYTLSPGETFENKIIDISADGADYSIVARSDSDDDFTIRNIGFRGPIPDYSETPGDPPSRILLRTGKGGTIRVENVYSGDGLPNGDETDPSRSPGIRHNNFIYVWPEHAGEIHIRNVTCNGGFSNGCYASPPAISEDSSHPAHPAGGGVVTVENWYATGCQTSGMRLGSEGSYAKNVVCWDNRRGVWGYMGHGEVIDADFGNNWNGDVEVGGSRWEDAETAELTVSNSRFKSTTVRSRASLNGSSAGSPKNRIPEDCPTSAEEAATGSGTGGGGSNGDGGNTTAPYEPEGDFELSVTTRGDFAEYLLELEAASVEPGDGADTHDHEYQDRAFEHDGRWYVHGYTAGGTDDFHVEDGEILRAGQLEGASEVRADGKTVGLEAFDEIESVPNPEGDVGPSGDFELEFTSSGFAEYLVELEADAVEPGDSADTHDHEYQDRAFEHDGRWYVHGYTAGGTDDFHVEDGEILRAGQLEGASEIRADGERLDLETFDEIESVPGSDGDGLRTLEVAGQFRYRVEVDGEIEPAEEHARWVAEGEAYGDDWAEWWLSGSDDARTVWEFTGEITALEVDDHDGATEIRTLAVDGDDVDPNDY